MASYGSIPLFHIVGVTPECHKLSDVGGDMLSTTEITREALASLGDPLSPPAKSVDVVVFAPSLSLVEQPAGSLYGPAAGERQM